MKPWRAGLLVLLLLPAMTTLSAEIVFEEHFARGAGSFQSEGRVIGVMGEILMLGGAEQTAITSSPISTRGYQNLVLKLDHATSGLDEGELAEVALSVNNGPYTRLETVTATGSGSVDVALDTTAENKDSIRVRFRLEASSLMERYAIGSVVLEADENGDSNEATDPTNPTGPTDPPASDVSDEIPAAGDFVTFESGHVRPLALNSDGSRLFAVNTPDNRIEIFDTSGSSPQLIESVRVGLEPVAVALRDDAELWVVNHLSDSVSIIDISVTPALVKQTLLVGDEPRDVVFGGANDQWAFITAAHRGQNVPFDPQLTTAGVGRADVWVFNALSPGNTLTGTPATILNMFGDTLRALARNADGSRLYAAVFNSGNRTTVLTDDRGQGGIDKAPPYENAAGEEQPETGLIVQYNGRNWVDNGDPVSGVAPKIWDDRVNLTLPDYDVFEIDASGSIPRVINRVSGVGTTLFNMAVNPQNGQVYVSNQEARNVVRFEGPGNNATTVNGHFVESRITVLQNGVARPRHLNKHIDYSRDLGTSSEKSRALAIPLEMAISPDGGKLYLAAMGSGKLARFDTNALAADSFTPSEDNQVTLSGGGPTGVVLDSARNRAYVATRFDNGISVVSTANPMTETAHIRMFNPEPAAVKNGRRFMYDANYTSSRGDSSCAGCHVFGDMDHLSWDLGNPDEEVVANRNVYNTNIPRIGRNDNFHPMKGPMTTQSLRGMKGAGPLHWRGDRSGSNASRGETLEEQAFEEFNVSFVDLLNRQEPLTEQEMDLFARYALQLTYPPNPIANLDNSLSNRMRNAYDVYNNDVNDTLTTCNGCHAIDPARGRFGTDGTMAIEGGGVEEDMKIPHLQNMYQKVGMFARNTQVRGFSNLGDQIRGFGYDNSGSAGSISNFLGEDVFDLTMQERAMLEELSLSAPAKLNPVVGQQVTVTPANRSRTDVRNRLELLVARALVTSPRPECELVAATVIDGHAVGWVMNREQGFVPSDRNLDAAALNTLLDRALKASRSATFTCVPPGNGTRIGIDRDLDGETDFSDSN
ncbi:hypothetical protein FT643_05465 [Ketobacter sp. MCCC 1A13808]|uniref:YncE family protein n=1 Tax=Ketobacter sp. MCCC 1A13808 TaxID=2602738 RepID=UPI0012EBE58D|nr:hypothetical protein [Ketobacter sp. MCCC 1A13808]MVF11589.1 hypothetical protein [Ketobacter sp. MCCC 1A13808]